MPDEPEDSGGQPRTLIVTAHPDDVDFGAAGTVAGWTKAGTEVSYCVATDGDAGGFDPTVPRSAIGGIRRAEQVTAAAELGVSDVRFLGYPDGLVVTGPGLVRDITRTIRALRPQRVVCPSPDRNYQRMAASHPDHRAVGAATLDAVYPAARNPFAFPELLAEEGLTDWVVPEVWLMGHPENNHYVDITDVFDRKMAALRAHVSQTGHRSDLDELLRSWNATTGHAAGFAAGRLAEGFFLVTVP